MKLMLYMSRPTLFRKGSLVSPTGDAAEQKRLDEFVPIEYIIDWFKERLNKSGLANRVLIVKSETASGKSISIPPQIYIHLLAKNGGGQGIICTQPRVLTAIENVDGIMQWYSKYFRRGENIGWSTGFNKLRPKTFGLLSATVGTLAQQLKTLPDEEIIAKYKYILIDETHERDLATDMTLYMLKNFLSRNADNVNCPFVVLMSATFEPKIFADYYGVPLETNFIWCRGMTAAINEMWDWNDSRTVSDYRRAAADVVKKIITENITDDPETADILIFMPGKLEFLKTAEWLDSLNKEFAETDPRGVFSLLQIDSAAVQTQNLDYRRLSSIPISEQTVHIGGKMYKPARRVIISTNVAETGFTLKNLKYVIDAGYNREIEFNPILGIRGLITKPAPQSRIRQRRGRVGRMFPGVFYPLYPKHIYDKLPVQQLPQILTDDISPIVLSMVVEQLRAKKLAGIAEPEFLVQDIDMVDIPTPDAISYCVEKMYLMGFLSPLSGSSYDSSSGPRVEEPKFGLSKLGELAASFNMISPANIRMILAAYTYGCSVLDIVTIVAYVTFSQRTYEKKDTESQKDNPLKGIKWQNIYRQGLRAFSSTPSLLYKIRLLIADEFINGLILFNAVTERISHAKMQNAVGSLKAWCVENNVSYHVLLDFIRTRDEIIEQLLTLELDIFSQERYTLANALIDEFSDIVTRIKYCIYEGYRGNILRRQGNKYVTETGLEVTVPALFREDERAIAEQTEYRFALSVTPSVMVYNELSLKMKHEENVYKVMADYVSVLDGIVNIDPDFAN